METYGYDELSRLTSVTYKDNVTQSYTFDKVGNGGG
jgi:YD repeat-containing protein